MTYSPYDPSTYEDEEQLKRYRENPGENFDGLYEGQDIVEGRPGSNEKVEDKPTESTSDQPNVLDKAGQFIEDNKGVISKAGAVAASAVPVIGRPLSGLIESQGYDTDAEKEAALLKGAALELPLIDFGMDAIGNIPGAAGIDDAWDEQTKFKNPNVQAARDVASVIVPSIALTMAAGPLGAKGAAAVGGGKILQGLSAISATAATDAAITGLSDYSERDEGLARGIDNFLEQIGRPMDLKIPQAIMVMDDDSPEVRHRKLMMESAGLSIVGDALAYVLGAGKPIMNWFKPKDEVAETFKQLNIRANPDPDTVFKTQELDEEILQLTDEIEGAAPGTDVSELIAQRDLLQEENAQLFAKYFDTGRTAATVDPLESYVGMQQASREWQTDDVGAMKLQDNPELKDFDPDVQSVLADESSRPRQSFPRGNIARNAADIGAIRSGTATGTPSPIISYPMLKEGMGLDSNSRRIVTELTDEYRQTGKYDAVVDGFRQTKKEIDDNAWDLTAEIVAARDTDELREAFVGLKATRQIAENYGVDLLVDSAVGDVGRALKILTNEFLGEEVTAMSSKAMFTTAKEVDTHLEAMELFRGQVDEDALSDIIIDKIGFLAEEYGMAKMAWGWSGNNFKWWQKKPDPVEIVKQFAQKQEANRSSALLFRDDLKRLKAENPQAARTLMMAYNVSKGNIDSYAKLNKWAKDQLSLRSVFVSGSDGESIFSRGLWNVLYNNALSGLSAGRAMVGNISALALKPVDYLIGAGIRGALKGDFEPLRRGFYAFGIQNEMIGRAVKEGWDMFIKASNDPQAVIDMARKDYQLFGDTEKWKIMDRMEQEFIDNKQFGQLAKLRWARVNQAAGMNKFMRYGQNLMMGVDKMSEVMEATMVSKLRAWDDTYVQGQKLDTNALNAAQEVHYSRVFDPKTNRLNDKWVNTQTRELALNDSTQFGDDISAMISKYPALRPFIMFPNTGINFVRKTVSYTPFAALPNSNKYAKTILAKSDEQVGEALMLHGIPSDDPMGRTIVDNLATEYLGRIATGAMVTMGLMNYALSGNIRGNWPRDPRQRAYLKANGWQPKQIKVGGIWISYDGIIPLDPLLTTIGDLGYYANDLSSPLMEDIRDKIIWTIGQSLSGATPLQGLEPLVALAGGDDTAMSRFLGNQARLAIPQSSGMAVLAKAWDSTSKEIYDDLQGYIASRIPFANSTVPDKYDWWTGQRANEIDNPILRILNAVNPLPVTANQEPWRLWVNQSGFNASTYLLKDSTGSYEYNNEQRSIMSKYIGEQEIWKEVEKMRTNKKYNDQLDTVRAELATGKTYDQLQPDTRNLPVLRRLTNLVKSAKEVAEAKMYETYPSMQVQIAGSKLSENMMRQGRVSEAYDKAEKTQEQVKQLEQFR
tara:strand:- start:1919 stop:6076 length:4158 start_codon:yes stop_codon:yes gene_type:complete